MKLPLSFRRVDFVSRKRVAGIMPQCPKCGSVADLYQLHVSGQPMPCEPACMSCSLYLTDLEEIMRTAIFGAMADISESFRRVSKSFAATGFAVGGLIPAAAMGTIQIAASEPMPLLGVDMKINKTPSRLLVDDAVSVHIHHFHTMEFEADSQQRERLAQIFGVTLSDDDLIQPPGVDHQKKKRR